MLNKDVALFENKTFHSRQIAFFLHIGVFTLIFKRNSYDEQIKYDKVDLMGRVKSIRSSQIHYKLQRATQMHRKRSYKYL